MLKLHGNTAAIFLLSPGSPYALFHPISVLGNAVLAISRLLDPDRLKVLAASTKGCALENVIAAYARGLVVVTPAGVHDVVDSAHSEDVSLLMKTASRCWLWVVGSGCRTGSWC